MKYQTDPIETERLRQLVRDTAAQVAKVTGAKVSQAASDAASDYQSAVQEVLDEETHLRTILAELGQKTFLLNPAGVAQLRKSIVADHKQRATEADQRAAAALDALKSQLQRDSLPAVDPAREALGRQELTLLSGNANGEALVANLMQQADSGSPDAVSVLLSSSFGVSLLNARGVTGRRASEVMQDLRTVAANAAARRGDNDAASLIGIENDLAAARSAAMSTMTSAADEALGLDMGAAR